MAILVERQNYLVKLAENDQELDQVYALRFNIFNTELGEGIAANEETKRDRDQFDEHCDQLMLLYDGKLIGTYRILRFSKKPGKFYSEEEFDFSPLYVLGDKLAELGRSCIAAEHRQGAGVTLLWAGLYQYCTHYGIENLAGCSSILKENAGQVSALYSYFKEEGHLSQQYQVKSHNLKGFTENAEPSAAGISSLLKMYLKIGAKVLGPPCWDPIFGCYDFPVMFKITAEVPYMKFLQRYLQKK